MISRPTASPTPPDQGELATLARGAEQLARMMGPGGAIKPSVDVQALQVGWERDDFVTAFQLADGKAPSEFRIFKAGQNPSTKGTFLFDEEAAASVMALWAERELDLMMDYEHMSLVKPPIIAPASAKKFVPEVRQGELWATQVQWTERARQMLEDGEYRYFSPAFHFDPETGRIYYLINVALTNNPALNAAAPLMAATADGPATPIEATATTTEPKTMKKMSCTGCTATLKAKGDDGEPDGDEMYCTACLSAAKEGASGRKVLNVLGLSLTAGEPAVLTAVEGVAKFRTEAMALTGKDTLPAALGVLTAWKQKAEERDTLVAKLDKLEQEALGTSFEASIKAKVDAKHISPAQAQDFTAKAKRDGRFDKERVELVTGMLSAFDRPIASGTEVRAPSGSMGISEQERQMCLSRNQDPEEYAKWKAGAIQRGEIPAGV